MITWIKMLRNMLAAVCICSGLIYGQAGKSQDTVKTIEQEILAHPGTDIILLGKARAVLLESLKKNDPVRASKVLEYINAKFDTSRMIPLYNKEKIFTYLLLRQYDNIFSLVLRPGFEIFNWQEARTRLIPQGDLLDRDLENIVRTDAAAIKDGIRKASLPAYKRDFLCLLFDALIIKMTDENGQVTNRQNILNSEADEYLSMYRESEFNPFIRNNIRFVFAKSSWGFGYEVAAGYLNLPLNLTRHLNGFFVFSFALETAYKQTYCGLRFDLGTVQNVRREFAYKGIWKEGLDIMHLSAALEGGPMIELGNSIRFTPLIGFSTLDFSTTNDEKDKGIELSLDFPAWTTGFNLDISPAGGSSSYLRLKFGYRGAMTNADIAKGGYTYLTIGFGFFSWPELRDL